jgi:hypothetical protein
MFAFAALLAVRDPNPYAEWTRKRDALARLDGAP